MCLQVCLVLAVITSKGLMSIITQVGTVGRVACPNKSRSKETITVPKQPLRDFMDNAI
jgi:hypothetical protein